MKDILLPRPDGSFYLYYREKCNSLLLKQYNKSGVFVTTPTVLRKNVEPHFSAAQDSDGNIHVAFSTANSIHYGYFTESTFRSFPILTSKSPMMYQKQICLLAAHMPVTVFYLVRHKGKILLSMQQILQAENTATSPVAIDHLTHPEQNFAACQSQEGTIYLAYSRGLRGSERISHVIRELTPDGETIQQQELPIKAKEALYMDFFGFDKNNSLTLFSHTISYSDLYICSVDAEITQMIIDLNTYPGTKSAFFGQTAVEKDIKIPRDVVSRNFDT